LGAWFILPAPTSHREQIFPATAEQPVPRSAAAKAQARAELVSPQVPAEVLPQVPV